MCARAVRHRSRGRTCVTTHCPRLGACISRLLRTPLPTSVARPLPPCARPLLRLNSSSPALGKVRWPGANASVTPRSLPPPTLTQSSSLPPTMQKRPVLVLAWGAHRPCSPNPHCMSARATLSTGRGSAALCAPPSAPPLSHASALPPHARAPLLPRPLRFTWRATQVRPRARSCVCAPNGRARLAAPRFPAPRTAHRHPPLPPPRAPSLAPPSPLPPPVSPGSRSFHMHVRTWAPWGQRLSTRC